MYEKIDWEFTDVCSSYTSICSDVGLAPNRWRVNIWTKDVRPGLDELINT